VKKGESLLDNPKIVGYLMITPWLIGFIVIYFIPMIASLVLSFTNYTMLNTPKFVGLDNFKRMFTQDATFWPSLGVTFYYVFAVVPLRLAFALFVAMLLNSKRKFLGMYRAVFYIPSLIGGSVAVAIIWRQMFGDKGVLMSLLALVGVYQKTSLIGDTSTAIWTIIILGVWQFGSSMLIFLAGLKQIPIYLYEAAKMDGANSAQTFFKITLPMLTPIIFFNLILQIINSFKAFTESFIITNGGPMNSTLFFVLNLYKRAFAYNQMGYSCAMAWILVLIMGAFTLLLFRSQKRWVYYEKK
jgi:multiple sugar transport system permease protein